MSTTTTIRVPVELQEQVTRLSELVPETPGELLATAWAEYVEHHRDEFAADLQRAAQLMRDGTLEDLVDFAQDAHRSSLRVDVADLLEAWQDDDVQAVLRTARDAVKTSRRAGRRVEL